MCETHKMASVTAGNSTRACVGAPSDSNDEFVSNKESSATKNMPDLYIHHCL